MPVSCPYGRGPEERDFAVGQRDGDATDEALAVHRGLEVVALLEVLANVGRQGAHHDRAAAIEQGHAQDVVARGPNDVHRILRGLDVDRVGCRASFEDAANRGQGGQRLNVGEALGVPGIHLVGDEQTVRAQRGFGLLLESGRGLGVAERGQANGHRDGNANAQGDELGRDRPGSDAHETRPPAASLVVFTRLPNHVGYSLLVG